MFVLLTTGCYSIGYANYTFHLQRRGLVHLKVDSIVPVRGLKKGKPDYRVILDICLLGRLQDCLASA